MTNPFLHNIKSIPIKTMDDMDAADWQAVLDSIKAKPYDTGDFLISCMPTRNGSHFSNNMQVAEKTLQPILLLDPAGNQYLLVLANEAGCVFDLVQARFFSGFTTRTVQDSAEVVFDTPVCMFGFTYDDKAEKCRLQGKNMSIFKSPFLMIVTTITEMVLQNEAVGSAVYLVDEALGALRKKTFTSPPSFTSIVKAVKEGKKETHEEVAS